MTLARPTLSELIDRVRSDFETRLPGADSRLRNSVLDVTARVHGGGAAALYGYLDFIARQILPDTAEAEFLARWAGVWGLQRKAAVAATGSVTFTGTNGVAIPAGSELVRVDGVAYKTAAAGAIVAGEAELTIEASVGGPAGNSDIGTALTLASAIEGVSGTASAATALTGGAEEESDALLLERLLLRIRKPPQGGALDDYRQWALELPEVTRAWVYPGWMGEGTVGVTFVFDGREDILPGPGDVEAMEDYLAPLRPVTAEVIVFAPVAREVDLYIRLTPSTDAVKAAVEEELKDMFARDAEPGGVLYLSRLSEAISLAQGETSHVLQLPSVDIVANAGEMPFLGDIVWVE